MIQIGRLAIIGVGSSAIYLLKHLFRNIDWFLVSLTDTYLFDKRAALCIGIPFDRNTTDKYKLCNISSAEIPLMNEPLVDWLHSLSDDDWASPGLAQSQPCTKIFPNQPNAFRERRFTRPATACG